MRSGVAAAEGVDVVSAQALLSLVDDLAELGAAGDDLGAADDRADEDLVVADAGLIDRITALERVKRAAAAAQARLAVAFDTSRREQQRAGGMPAARVGRGVADQVALARMESPHRGGRHLGLAKVLVTELPCTMAALERGDVSEWGATLVARETAILTAEQRRHVDDRLADLLARQGVSDKQLGDAARAVAYELDPHAAVKRAAKAETDRCVTLRPAPDTMSYLTAHLPVAAGVAAYAALDAAARTAAATGDPRTRGQVMADTLLARLLRTGTFTAPAPSPHRTAQPTTATPTTATLQQRRPVPLLVPVLVRVRVGEPRPM